MVWVAFDRAVQAVEEHGLDGPVERWRELRDRVREEILDKGFDHERGTFTQHYDTTEVDASLLTIPLVGFLPGDDPRVLGTIDAVIADLDERRPAAALPHRDGRRRALGRRAPVPRLLLLAGVRPRRWPGVETRPTELMDRLCGLANDVGLLSEEYDTAARSDGGQLPPGVQPPDPRAGGPRPAVSRTRAAMR